MKKTFLFMLVAIILGSISGKLLFSKYDEVESAFSESKTAYFIQEGVYLTKSSLESNTKTISPKIVIEENGKYYVYVGITSNYKNVKKIKKVYLDKGYNVVEKKVTIDNDEFMANLSQFDILIENASSSEIENIEKIVLSNYEDLVP